MGKNVDKTCGNIFDNIYHNKLQQQRDTVNSKSETIDNKAG